MKQKPFEDMTPFELWMADHGLRGWWVLTVVFIVAALLPGTIGNVAFGAALFSLGAAVVTHDWS